MGAVSVDDLWQMPCTNSGSLNLQFAGAAGPSIGIPFTDLLSSLYDEDDNPKVLNGARICAFKLYPTWESDTSHLGTVFLNSAYIVIDHDQAQVSLAQGNRNLSGSNILEIVPGPRGIPGVASTVTGPLPSDYELAVATTSSNPVPTYKTNSAVSKYLLTAVLYKVVAIILVIAI